jgi:hypothetical protein
MIHWRARLIFLSVVALTVVSATGGAIHWSCFRVISAD